MCGGGASARYAMKIIGLKQSPCGTQVFNSLPVFFPIFGIFSTKSLICTTHPQPELPSEFSHVKDFGLV